MAALRSRVLARVSVELPHVCPTACAITVSTFGASASDGAVWPSAHGGIPRTRRRRASLPSGLVAAPTGPAASGQPAPVRSSQEMQGRQAAAQPSSHQCCSAEPTVSQVLVELEQCGMRVAWPRHLRSVAGSLAAAPWASPRCAQDACLRPLGPVPAPEVAEASRELEELRMGWAICALAQVNMAPLG